jgi:N-acetylglucosaminyl-diphospho-decaprenol L-rhamnosyltransferase
MTPGAVDVTVGIVAWNAAEDLERCLSALPAALGALSAQIVVVDNGSQDGTAAVLAAHAEASVIRNAANRGITPARNEVLERRRGRYVLMLDADTRPAPGSIAAMTGYLDDHPEVGLVGPRLVDPDGSLQLSCRTFPPLLLPFLVRPPLQRAFARRRTLNRHFMRGVDHGSPRAVDWVIGASQCFRASLLAQLGRYDERILSYGGEDTDWCVRVWMAGFEVHYLPSAEVVHAYGHYTRRHPLSRQAFRSFADFFYMQAKHRGHLALLPSRAS